jgi:hypothetical protein
MSITKKLILLFSLGLVLNLIILFSVCQYFSFDTKSAISIYVASAFGYFSKSVLFILLFILFNYVVKIIDAKYWFVFAPTMFFATCFLIVKLFSIEGLYFDLSAGYFSYVPHYISQLITTLLSGVILTVFIRPWPK